MPATFYQTASWTTQGVASGVDFVNYKDVAVTAAPGDLIVAFGASANTNTSDIGTLQTVTGATGTWAIGYTNTVNESCGYVIGHAVSSTNGALTVRVGVPNGISNLPMGAGALVVPAAEWSGTPAYTPFGTNQADPSPSVTVPGTRALFYAAADWSGTGAVGTAYTPAGAVVDVNASSAGNYAVGAAHWSAQATGTRDYGPTAPVGNQFTGAVVQFDEVAVASTRGFLQQQNSGLLLLEDGVNALLIG